MSWRGRSCMDKGGLASQICHENYDEGWFVDTPEGTPIGPERCTRSRVV
jgi:hypothetical protein